MELQTDFRTFLQDIRPTSSQQDNLQTGHQTLRNRLSDYEPLSEAIVTTFLQGSYRRSTAVRPKEGHRLDVDVIVVTKFDRDDYSPREAMETFEPFLEKYYEGKWRKQGRSFGIKLSYVELDLVLTAAPAESQVGVLRSDAVRANDTLKEARDWRLHPSWIPVDERSNSHADRVKLAEAKQEEEWRTEPLYIPDRKANEWEPTDPLKQNQWTRDKNSATDGHFVNVVKAIKWWRLENYDEPEHPKSFPLERLIGECCPDDIDSVAGGITQTLENIVSDYRSCVDAGEVPELPDYGVEEHDVFGRITYEEFAQFFEQVQGGAQLARRALDSTNRTESGELWRELLGPKFPEPPEGGSSKTGGFSSPDEKAELENSRFA